MSAQRPRILGAIIAGGEGRRFGSDKALAPLDGRPLIAHTVDALRPQVHDVVVCGREWEGLTRLDDRPMPGLGPMGGINAALHHGAELGFDAVLTAPVDIWPLPDNLAELLDVELNGFALLEEQFMIGLWPTALATAVDDYITGGGRTLRGLIDPLGARLVADPPGLSNINRQSDMPPATRRASDA